MFSTRCDHSVNIPDRMGRMGSEQKLNERLNRSLVWRNAGDLFVPWLLWYDAIGTIAISELRYSLVANNRQEFGRAILRLRVQRCNRSRVLS